MKVIVQSYDKQSGKAVLQCCISFKDIKKIARFTARRAPGSDPYALEEDSNNEYQRPFNEAHIKEIVKYINNSIKDKDCALELDIFPTPLLISFNCDENLEIDDSNITDIKLPDDYCYIVDGQHRLMAMIQSLNQTNQEKQHLLEEFRFNCIVLLNYDMWEQAKVFADVNFKQKKVNKSLYYDIYGSEPPENSEDYWQNAIFIAHAIVEHLNKDEESPLYQDIKMLGRGKGVISQAFLVESLLRHIQTPRGIWYVGKGVPASADKIKCMILETSMYLKTVKKHFKEEWSSEQYIIRKTTGIGALIRLMGYIHRIIQFKNSSNEIIFDEEFYNKEYEKCIDHYIHKISEHKQLFKKGDKYGIGGSVANQAGLYKELVNIIES